MKIVTINVMDGKGPFEVVVADSFNVTRLLKFFEEAKKLFNEQEEREAEEVAA
jgi:hypothetical protein